MADLIHSPSSKHQQQQQEEQSPSMNADVWQNLKDIFADLDAHCDKSENKLLLQNQILHLRRLLQIHTDLIEEESQLQKIHLGLLYEREWFTRKLQALEVTIGPPPSQSGGGGGKNRLPVTAIAGAIRAILYTNA